MAYSQTHPDRCKALILRGIFLLRQSELQFFYQHGTSDIYPEAYEEYASFIPEEERHDLMTAYLKRLTSDDEALSLEAARRWSTWEESTNRLIQDPEGIHTKLRRMISGRGTSNFSVEGEADSTRAFARIENHYFVNKGFFPEDGHLIKEAQLARM